MNIADFLPFYPSIEDDNFNQLLYNKKELREIVIPRTEEFPKRKGDLMSHQVLLGRLLSTYTPYNEMLLYHEMGTGKTCSAISIMEKIRAENNGINEFIYVAKNDDLLSNFEADFFYKCTASNYEEMKPSDLNLRLYTNYNFLNKYDNKTLKNAVVVIDEIHNIRKKRRREGKESSYDILHKILHSTENCKIILMSGTPMVDQPSEMASVMNLILPLSQQLPFGSEFNSTFFDENLQVKQTEISRLRNAFKGRISYIKSMDDGIIKKYIGSVPSGFQHFIISESTMSDFQTEQYKALVSRTLDSNEETHNVANQRPLQLADIVAPNGKYGTELQPSDYNRIFKPTDTLEEKLTQLSKYSCKYADSIRTILKARQEKKCVFVFNSHVSGGGLSAFALLLKLFGFTELNFNSNLGLSATGNRFIYLTGDTQDNKKLRDRFNQPDNIDGDIISVVLASDAITEGYSFNNISVIDIHSPWYNFSNTSQAIARGIRVGSHRALLSKLRVDTFNVEIYLRVSRPNDPTVRCVDEEVYKFAEKKDLAIKQIEHIAKEESIDSMFALERNRRNVLSNGSRDCDYTTCQYIPFPTKPVQNQPLDYSTYRLYYANRTALQKTIMGWFETTNFMKFETMTSGENSGISQPELLMNLDEIICKNIIVAYRYGLPCFLREGNDVFYLVNNLSNMVTQLDNYYVEHPMFSHKVPKVLQPDTSTLLNTVKNICESKNILDLNFAMRRLSDMEKEQILEGNILGLQGVRNPSIELKFSGQFGEINGVMYSWYLLNIDKVTARKLVDKVWYTCSSDEVQIIKQHLQALEQTVKYKTSQVFLGEKKYYGYYSYNDLYNESKHSVYDFTIREINQPKGLVCINFQDKKDLVAIYNSFRNTVPIENGTKQNLCDMIRQKMIEENILIRDHRSILS